MAVSLLLGGNLAIADDDPPAEQRLTEAVKLYDNGQYEQSRQLLREIEDSDLKTQDEKLQLQRYLSLTATAIAGVQDAWFQLGRGNLALEENRPDEARKHFQAVIENRFAPDDLKARAQARLKTHVAKTADKAKPSSQSVSPDTQKALDHASLVDILARENELLWQKAVASYKATAGKIRKAVNAEDFDEARRLLAVAKQTVELNRRYASPVTRYEDLRQQALDLEAFLEDEHRVFEEYLIKKQVDEVKQRETARMEHIRQNQQRQIDQLLEQAAELRKERRLEQAIQVLDQVLGIDPNHDQAKWMRETLEDLMMNIRDRDAVRERSRHSQDVYVSNDEANIPYNKDITYPKNWREITSIRRDTEAATESPETLEVRKRLQKTAPELRFDAEPFEEVINKLRALTGLNIVPNWSALEASAIEKDAEVSLRLDNVKFEKAMELILDNVGAGEVELAFEIDEGVIQISTKEDLSRKTVTRVYNVQDLIISVPTFRGREIDLNQIGQSQGQQGGLGGGRFVGRGGGQGGGGGGQGGQGGLFGGEGGEEDEDQGDLEDPLEPIVELIQETIDPESWREAGGNVGSISDLNQQLIVTQTSTAHAELRDLLKQLRQARALQIAVEARYITISRNWLEQIGVDLDVVLNNGNAGFDRTSIRDPNTNLPILVPRQFTRLGFTPGAPGGVGIGLPTRPFGQPFGQPGLVPQAQGAANNFTPIPLVNNTLDLAAPSDTNINGSLGSLVNSTPAFQIFGSFLDNIQVDFLLRASQVDKRSSNLDAPRLVLFNGQRATFESFIEQDYIAALTPVIGDNAGAFTPNVDTALTGRSLDVQATVSADRRYVTMTVRTFTRVTGDFRTVFFGGSQTVGSGFIELATQTTQQIRTTVSVPDGGTLLIGGLKLSGERDVDAGVPILSRIPILKRAFSNTSNVKDDQVLLILIKPTIIIQEEAEAEAFPTLSAAGSGF